MRAGAARGAGGPDAVAVDEEGGARAGPPSGDTGSGIPGRLASSSGAAAAPDAACPPPPAVAPAPGRAGGSEVADLSAWCAAVSSGGAPAFGPVAPELLRPPPARPPMFANLGGASDDGVTSRRGSTGPAAGEGGGASPPRRPLTTHALEMEIVQRVQAYTDGELETVRQDVTDLQLDVTDARCLVMKMNHELHKLWRLQQLQQHRQKQEHRQLQQKLDELHQQLQQLEELHQGTQFIHGGGSASSGAAAADLETKNGLQNYCFLVRNTLRDEKMKKKCFGGDKEKRIEEGLRETLVWLENNQSVEKDKFETKQKELEGIVNPIMTHVAKGLESVYGLDSGTD